MDIEDVLYQFSLEHPDGAAGPDTQILIEYLRTYPEHADELCDFALTWWALG